MPKDAVDGTIRHIDRVKIPGCTDSKGREAAIDADVVGVGVGQRSRSGCGKRKEQHASD